MKKQLLPITISLGLFCVFAVLTYLLVSGLNLFGPATGRIILTVSIGQFVLGIFIYLKTAVDYALFVGNLMEKNPGIKSRIAMNVGTQIGCFVGVTAIAILWYFFKEIHLLMAVLLLVAGAILIKLGDGSQEHFESLPRIWRRPLELFFDITRPVVSKITFFMPDSELKTHALPFWRLFFISMIIPFALGADDLAGYMTLLTAVDCFSLLIGIYFGDAIIDIALFISPKLTITIVKNKWVSYVGALFFIGLGVLSVAHAFHYLI